MRGYPQKRMHPVAQVEHDSDSSDENYIYAMTSDKAPKVNVKVCTHSFKATVDTGATINVIDHNTVRPTILVLCKIHASRVLN